MSESTHERTDGASSPKRPYVPPALEEFGTIADLTRVGQSNAGGDFLPGQSSGNDGGSVLPPGLSR